MCHGVLSGKGETGRSGGSNANALKNLTVFVKACECVVELVEGRPGEIAPSCDIAEVEIGGEAPYDILGYETFDGRHPDLGGALSKCT